MNDVTFPVVPRSKLLEHKFETHLWYYDSPCLCWPSRQEPCDRAPWMQRRTVLLCGPYLWVVWLVGRLWFTLLRMSRQHSAELACKNTSNPSQTCSIRSRHPASGSAILVSHIHIEIVESLYINKSTNLSTHVTFWREQLLVRSPHCSCAISWVISWTLQY